MTECSRTFTRSISTNIPTRPTKKSGRWLMRRSPDLSARMSRLASMRFWRSLKRWFRVRFRRICSPRWSLPGSFRRWTLMRSTRILRWMSKNGFSPICRNSKSTSTCLPRPTTFICGPSDTRKGGTPIPDCRCPLFRSSTAIMVPANSARPAFAGSTTGSSPT